MKLGKNLQWKKERKHKCSLSPLQCAAPSLHHRFFLPLPQPPWRVLHATRCERLWDGSTGATEGKPRGEIRGSSISPSHPHEWMPRQLRSEPRSESWRLRWGPDELRDTQLPASWRKIRNYAVKTWTNKTVLGWSFSRCLLGLKRHQKCKQTRMWPNVAGVRRIKGSMWHRSKSFNSQEPRFETGRCQDVAWSLFTPVHSSLWASAAPRLLLGKPSRTKNWDLRHWIINPGNLWSLNWQSDAPDVTRTSISEECFQGHLSVDALWKSPVQNRNNACTRETTNIRSTITVRGSVVL